MIKIDGLSKEQVAMLDIIWGMDTAEEIQAFIENLDVEEQLEYQVLSKMVIFAVIDQAVDKMEKFEMAEILLTRIMYQI